MTASARTHGALFAANSGTSITPVIPGDAAVNDVMVFAAMCNVASTFTVPTDWAELPGTTLINSANQSTRWFWKRHDGSESNPTSTTSATGSTSAGLYGRIYVYKDALIASDPFEGVGHAGTPTSDTTPLSTACATSDVNRLVVSMVSCDDDNTWSSGNPPALWAIDGARVSSTVGGDCFMSSITRVMAASGTAAAVTIGTMSAADYWRTLTFALIPEPSASGITVTQLVQTQSASQPTGAQTVTSGSFDPPANANVYVLASVQNGNHNTAPDWSWASAISDTGSMGFTFIGQCATALNSGSAFFEGRMALFEAVTTGSPPTGVTVTLDAYSSTPVGLYSIDVFAVAADDASTVQIRSGQVVYNSADKSAATGAVAMATGTLPATTLSTSMVLSCFGAAIDSTAATVAPSGFNTAVAASALYETCAVFYEDNITVTTASTTDVGETVGCAHSILFEVEKVSGGTNGTATPAAIALAVTVPQAVLTAGSTVLPAVTALAVTVPQAVTKAGATASPAVLVAGPVVIPQAVLAAGATAAPAATALTVTLPAPSQTASSLVAPAVIPLAVTFPGASPGYVTFPAVDNNYLSTPDAAALEVTKLTLVAKIRPTTWTPAANKHIASRSVGGNVFRLILLTSGNLYFGTYDAGGVETQNNSGAYLAASGVVNGDWLWLAVAKDPDNGSSQKVCNMHWSRDGVVWTSFVANTTAGATVIYTGSTSALQIGAIGGGLTWAGDIGVLSYRDGVGAGGTVGGTEVFRFDGTENLAGVAAAANSFTASTGQTVTVNHAGGSPTVIVPPVSSPTTQAGATASPSSITATLSLPAVTAAAGSTVTPAVIPLAVTIPQASATGGGSATALPAAITLNVTIPQAVAQAGAVVLPAATVLSVTIPQAVTQAGATASPAVIPLTVTIPAATASGANPGTASPAAITTTVTIPQATPVAGSTVLPGAVTLTVTMPAALPQVSKTATPSVIPLTVTIPAATASGTSGATATPNAIALVTVIPSPTLTYGYVVNPDVIALAVSIGAAIASGLPPDANPITVTLRDAGHTVTVQVVGTTATILDSGHTATAQIVTTGSLREDGTTTTLREN